MLTFCASSVDTVLSAHSALVISDILPTAVTYTYSVCTQLACIHVSKHTYIPDTILSQNGAYLVPTNSILVSLRKPLNKSGSEFYTTLKYMMLP